MFVKASRVELTAEFGGTVLVKMAALDGTRPELCEEKVFTEVLAPVLEISLVSVSVWGDDAPLLDSLLFLDVLGLNEAVVRVLLLPVVLCALVEKFPMCDIDGEAKEIPSPGTDVSQVDGTEKDIEPDDTTVAGIDVVLVTSPGNLPKEVVCVIEERFPFEADNAVDRGGKEDKSFGWVEFGDTDPTVVIGSGGFGVP